MLYMNDIERTNIIHRHTLYILLLAEVYMHNPYFSRG